MPNWAIPSKTDIQNLPPTSYDVDFNCDIDTHFYEFDSKSQNVRSVSLFTGMDRFEDEWWPLTDLAEFESNELYRAVVDGYDCYVRVYPDGLEFTSLTRS